MKNSEFRAAVRGGQPMVGTFVKTPSYQIIEVLAGSDLDFAILDAEHAPFDRQALDACMAISVAHDFPLLVRIGDGSAKEILWALDSGAVGIVVPHVDSAEKAASIARAARFGPGGRGYAGSTRWAGYGLYAMPDVLPRTVETTVIVQIEEPAGVDAVDDIAKVDGVDALFVGPSDLSIAYGYDHAGSDELKAAVTKIAAATKREGKGFASFMMKGAQAADWRAAGVSMIVLASEHNWMRDMANAETAAARNG